MRIHIDLLPSDIIYCYNLRKKQHGDYVYIRINKGMYGLKEAAVLAYHQLSTFLAKYGYHHVAGTTGL